MSFAAPAFGLCALLALFVVYAALRSRAPLGRAQRIAVAALQCGAILSLAFALAEPWRTSDGPVHRIAVLAAEDPAAREQIRAWRAGTSAREPFHAIAAGRVPVLALPGTAEPPPVDGTPDLAEALRVAAALVPAGARGEIALCSDGRHDGARLELLASELLARDIALHVLKVARAPRVGARIVEVEHPARVAAGEPFRWLVRADADRPGAARLRVRLGERVLLEREVALRGGEQRIDLEIALHESGALELATELATDLGAESSGSAPAPSLERSAVLVEEPLLALHLTPDPSRRTALASTLAPHGVRTIAPEDPSSASAIDLERVAVVIVDDLAAPAWSDAAQEALRSAVLERGLGLVLAGTHANLGPGGYGASPLAPILPVRMPQREERRDPSVALVVILDTSGSMGGGRIELAKEVARLAIQVLQPHDKVGLVEFYGSKRWAAPLQPASNAIEITRALNRLQAGGGTVIYDALEEAYYALLNSHTRFQHVLVLTDGGVESGPFEALARRMTAAGQNLSTVLIGPQGNSPFLMSLAQWGRGRFYACPDRFQLPELRFREPQSALLPSVEERAFALERADEADLLKSFSDGPLPPAGAVVEAGVRDGAEVLLRAGGKPYLLGWDQGAGRVLVLAGEALGPASGSLREDPSYGAFLADLVRNAAAGAIGAAWQLRCRAHESGVSVQLDVPPLALLPIDARLRAGEREIALVLAGDRRLEAFLPWSDSRVHVLEALDSGTTLARGAAIAPLDRRDRCADASALLARIADLTGSGVIAEGNELPAEPRRVHAAHAQGESLQPLGIALALACFLAALLLRRLPLERARASAWLALFALAGLGAGQAPAQELPRDEDGIYAAIGVALREKGDLSALQSAWKDASPEHHLALAIATGDLDRAAALLAKPELASSHAELALRLAAVRGDADGASKAAAALEADESGEPLERAERALLRASLEAELGRSEAARAALRAAVAHLADPRFVDRAGLTAAALGEIDLALEWHRPEALQGKLAYHCALRRGLWQQRRGDPAAAAVEYERAHGLAPLERDAAFALALLLAVERERGELAHRAESWLERLRREPAAFTPAEARALIEALRELGRAKDAWLALQALPVDARAPFRDLAVALAVEAGCEEDALRELRARLDAKPKDVEARVQLALLYSDLQRDAEAEAVLLERLESAPRPELRRLATAATELGLDGAVARCTAALRAFDTPADRIDAALIESAHRVRRERREEAIQGLLAVDEPSAAPAERLRLGEALESLGRSAEAQRIFEAVYAETSAEDLGLRLAWMLSQSKEAAERDRALAIYRRLWLEAGSSARRVQAEDHVLDLAAREGTLADLALELETKLADPALEERRVLRDALVKIHSRAKDSLGAAALLRAWIRNEPEHEIEALEQLARVHLANDEYRAYGRVLEELIAKNPAAELDYRQQLALAALERGRPAEAQRCLRQLLDRESALGPTELEFAAGIYTLAGQHEDAVRLYRRSLALHPERVETFLLLGNALRAANRSELGIGLFQALLLDDLQDDLFVVAVDGLLNLEADRATLRAAAASVRLRLAARPEQVFLERLLQDVLDALREDGARLHALEETALVAGEQRVAFVRELMQEAETRRDRRTYLAHGRTLLLLGDEVPPAIFLSLGEALLKEGDLDAASRAFERARLAPDFATVETRVAELFERAGRLAEAERARKRLLRRTPDDAKQILATARICEQRSAEERALALYLDAAARLLPAELEAASRRAAPGSSGNNQMAARLVMVNRNRAPDEASFADAFQGALRCANERAQIDALVERLFERFAACTESELQVELVLAGYLRRVSHAFRDRALAERVQTIELEHLDNATEPRPRKTALAASRLSSSDIAGWEKLDAQAEDWPTLRWLFLSERWEELSKLAARVTPALRAEVGRCYLLAGKRAEAEALASALEAEAQEDPDAAGDAAAKLADWLGRPVDERALAARRLARALASPQPLTRRARLVLSALQSHPTLDRAERRGILLELASEISAAGDVPLIRALLEQAGKDLEPAIAEPLVARLFSDQQQGFQVVQDVKHLALLPPERALEIARGALRAMAANERRVQTLRLVQTQVERLPIAVLRPLIEDLDLRRLDQAEGFALIALARAEGMPQELLSALAARLEAADPRHPALALLALRALPAEERAARAQEQLAEMESGSGADDPARTMIRAALLDELSPEQSSALAAKLPPSSEASFRATLLERAGRRGEAAEELLAALERDPQNTSLVYRTARLLQELERFDDARKLYRKAREQSAQFYPYQARELALLELRAKNPDGALEALQSVEDPLGQNQGIWLEVIAALPDAERRLALLRRLGSQSATALNRGIVVFSRAGGAAGRHDDLATALELPPFPPPRAGALRSELAGQDADAAQVLARLPEGVEHVERLLRAQDPVTLERDDTLLRARLLLAVRDGETAARIDAALAELAAHPFDPRALAELRAADALELAIPAAAREALFRWRISAQQLDALALSELYAQSVRNGEHERSAALRPILLGGRGLLGDARLYDAFLPGFLSREASPDELLSLAPPAGAQLEPRLDAEIVAAALRRGVDLDRLESLYGARIDERSEENVFDVALRCARFGLLVARGDVDALGRCLTAEHTQYGRTYCPPHLLGAAIPLLAQWRKAELVPAVAAHLLENAAQGSSEHRALFLRLAAVLAARLAEAGRADEAQALREKIRVLDPELKAKDWLGG